MDQAFYRGTKSDSDLDGRKAQFVNGASREVFIGDVCFFCLLVVVVGGGGT